MAIEKNIKPVQPYLLVDTDNYIQTSSDFPDISHFYSFSCRRDTDIRIVPDGSMDMAFAYSKRQMNPYITNVKLHYSNLSGHDGEMFFGARFMPALLPKMFAGYKCRPTTVSREIFVPWNYEDEKLLNRLSTEKNFNLQVEIFSEWYRDVEPRHHISKEKKMIIDSVRQLIIDSAGKIKISELREKIGYSERYINKLFVDEIGFSPKTFCKIVQFQKSLEHLDYDDCDNMTDAAVELGYYDQAQFTKDFLNYAGITPKRYYEMMLRSGFREMMSKVLLKV